MLTRFIIDPLRNWILASVGNNVNSYVGWFAWGIKDYCGAFAPKFSRLGNTRSLEQVFIPTGSYGS
jgi:hypothetical protein